ncbi:MAG: hypothetical protein R2759_13035 [Bacteroidales bacterium]
MAISLGEGSLDALFGILGGVTGRIAFYTVLLPYLSGILGPDFGTISLNSSILNNYIFWGIAITLSVLFITLSFWMHKIEKGKR